MLPSWVAKHCTCDCEGSGDDRDFDDDNEITDCPACGQTYDDADADFLICHHCGYDAEKKTYKHQSPSQSI